jgi:hypothetical protein
MGGGGPSSETTTVDPVYNAGLLALSQEQQGWAKEMYNMFKYGVTYDPTEKVTSEGLSTTQKVWVPQSGGVRTQTGTDPDGRPIYTTTPIKPGHYEDQTVPGTTTQGELQGYDPNAQTSEMQYLQNLVEANQGLLGLQTSAEKASLGLSEAQATAGVELLPYQTEATKAGLQLSTAQSGARAALLPGQQALAEKGIQAQSSFIDEASKGVNTTDWMNQAQAGVQHGFKLGNEQLRRDISSYGLDPSSGRYASQNRTMQTAEAAGVAGARTAAQRAGEAEDFRRKQVAAQGLTIPSV